MNRIETIHVLNHILFRKDDTYESIQVIYSQRNRQKDTIKD